MTQTTYRISLEPRGGVGIGSQPRPSEVYVELKAESETDAWKQAFEACSETQATIERLPE